MDLKNNGSPLQDSNLQPSGSSCAGQAITAGLTFRTGFALTNTTELRGWLGPRAYQSVGCVMFAVCMWAVSRHPAAAEQVFPHAAMANRPLGRHVPRV
jgi:hypothetical protein